MVTVNNSEPESFLTSKMPKRCVAAGCSNERNLEEGISLHKLPFYGDDRPEAKKRRKKWVDFVRLKRAKWEPSQSSVLCSKHFQREDFFRSADLGDEKNHHTSKRWLKTDDLGVNVFPSVHAKTLVPNANHKPVSKRSKRMVRRVRCTALKPFVSDLSFSPYSTLLHLPFFCLDH